MMKKCAVLLVIGSCFDAAMYGATTDSVTTIHEFSQEGDSKIQHQSEDESELFWSHARRYSNAYEKRRGQLLTFARMKEQRSKIEIELRNEQLEALAGMEKLIKNNRNILSSYRDQFEIRMGPQWRGRRIKKCYPHGFAARIACDRAETDHEWRFFQHCVQPDTHDRCIDMINISIRHCSFQLVRYLLNRKIDVTGSPQVMDKLFRYCTSLNNQYVATDCELTKLCTQPASVVEPLLTQLHRRPRSERDLLACLLRLSNKKIRLLAITDLLLRENANLSSVAKLIQETRVKHENCLVFQCIKHQIETSRTVRSLTTLPHVRSYRQLPLINVNNRAYRIMEEAIIPLHDSASHTSSSSSSSSSLVSSSSSVQRRDVWSLMSSLPLLSSLVVRAEKKNNQKEL